MTGDILMDDILQTIVGKTIVEVKYIDDELWIVTDDAMRYKIFALIDGSVAIEILE